MALKGQTPYLVKLREVLKSKCLSVLDPNEEERF
jgi:hypothetical protein